MTKCDDGEKGVKRQWKAWRHKWTVLYLFLSTLFYFFEMFVHFVKEAFSRKDFRILSNGARLRPTVLFASSQIKFFLNIKREKKQQRCLENPKLLLMMLMPPIKVHSRPVLRRKIRQNFILIFQVFTKIIPKNTPDIKKYPGY